MEHSLVRYGLAVLSVAVSLGLKLVFQYFGNPFPFTTCSIFAIAITVWYCGTGPGVLGVALSSLAIAFVVSLPILDSPRLPYVINHLGTALLVLWISAALRRAQRLLSQARGDLELKVEARTSELRRVNEELREEITERKRAEEELRQSEEKYRDLIEAAPDAIYMIDAGGNYILANPAGAELAGCPAHELIGTPMAYTCRPEERDLLPQRIERLKVEGPLRFEREFLRRNGEIVPVEVSVSPIRGRYNQAIVRDISERKRAEEALRASEQVARGQVEALTQSLDILATAPTPENLIGQMLGTIGRLLSAQSVVFWLLDEAQESLVLRGAAEGKNFDAADSEHPFIKDPCSWKNSPALPAMFFTGAPVVVEEIDGDPQVASELRDYFRSKGTRKFLIIPTLVTGHVKGFIGIRHGARAPYRPEEIELAQALAHQAMFAVQLNQFAEQSQQAAVLEERNRMARDIHDTLAQGFMGVIVQLEAAEDAILSGERAEADAHLHRAGKLARESLTEARRSVHALRPRALERDNFWEALKDLIKSTTAGTALHTSFELRGALPELPRLWQENLLHIGQEALTNTLKYAHARNFRTHLSCNAEGLRLELGDDGNGFDLEDRSGGLGLTGMRERVEQMHGQLEITSTGGAGTRVVVAVALDQEAMA